MFKLKPGDTIGIFSPSSPITANMPKRFQRGKAYLESKGFKIKEGSLTGKKDFYRSGSIQERVEEFNALIKDPEVKCIMSTIGGMNSNSMLPYIDYDSLKKNPKIIIGYSDVTAILLAIYEKCRIPTFYGPALVASFGELQPYVDMTFDYFENILLKDYSVPYLLPTPEIWTDEFINWAEQNRSKKEVSNELLTLKPGKVEGRVIGGNLNTIQGFWASEYMPEIKEGDILYIEDSLKDIATVERSFSFLLVNGIFDKVSGIILGKHELFNDMETGRKPYEVLLEVLGDRELPILAEFDCCHTHPMITLPLGSKVLLDATNKQVTLL